jgi:hypothetical protein
MHLFETEQWDEIYGSAYLVVEGGMRGSDGECYNHFIVSM